MVDVNGKKQILEKVQHELLEHPIDVYNFTVEDNHNYFVGGNGVLVHNFPGGACATVAKAALTGIQIQAIKKYALIIGTTIVGVLALLATGTLTWNVVMDQASDKDQDLVDDIPKIA